MQEWYSILITGQSTLKKHRLLQDSHHREGILGDMLEFCVYHLSQNLVITIEHIKYKVKSVLNPGKILSYLNI